MRAIEGAIVDVSPIFEVITERLELEIAEQATGFQLDGTDAFEIACGNAKESLAVAEMLKNRFDTGKNGRADLMAIVLHMGAH